MYTDPSGYAPILVNIDGKDYYPEEIPYLYLGRQNGKGIEAKANGDKKYRTEDFGVYGHIPAANNIKFNVFTAIKRLELDGLAIDELSAKLQNPSLSAKKRKSLEKELERRLQAYNNSYSTVSSYGFTIEDGYNVVKDDRYYTALAKVYYQGIAQHINDFQNNEYFAPFESTLQIAQAAQAIYMGAKLSQLMSKATNTYNNEAVSARNSKATYSNSYQYAEYTKPTFIDRLKEAANGVKNDAKVLGKRVVTETRGSARILPPEKPGARVGNKVKVKKSDVRDLLSGKDVEVNTIKEADALLKEALPNAKKAKGAKPPKIDPDTGKEIYDVDYSQFKGTDPNGIYHKDYQMNSKGEVYGHPGENPHKLFKHINVKLPDGTKVTIKIKPNSPNK
jgi:hypothetical protein